MVKNTHMKKQCTGALTTGIIIMLGLLILHTGCSETYAPGDDLLSFINYFSFSDGEVFSSRDITIEWVSSMSTNYFYKLDDSSWILTEDTYLKFEYLAEGVHDFYLRVEEDGDMADEVMRRSFEIDTITGPGIVFTPRRVIDSSEIVIRFEDVRKIMSAHIEIVSENGCASLNNFIKKKAGGGGGNSDFIALINNDDPERLIIDMAFAGYTDGVNGSIDFGSFQVSPLDKGKITIDLVNSRFKDINNIDISVDPESIDWIDVGK
ncbi:hypothetical protein ACFL60_04385 [Candidatus Omnitrophota bacterium]